MRKEERFFIDVAGRYGLGVELGELAARGAKVPGLVLMEGLFAEVGQPGPGSVAAAAERPPEILIPWLEGAVTFWGTERCYLDAWSWAKSKEPLARGTSDAREDADGGALRKEFIPNWSSSEFAQFVGRLGSLIDFTVADALQKAGDGAADAVKEAILARVEGKWKSLLAAEATFWPDLQ